MNSKLLHHNMSRFKKRERTQNWAYEEKRFLLELCRKDMKIIENKRLDSSLTALKNRAWRIIHQQFTATFGTDRDCNRLKEQWRRMKACTRAEMIDYQHRITRYGQEIADRKRPSPFTFEIWEFMQEAKRACKSEAMDDVDYSKLKLELEDNLPEGILVEDDLNNGELDDSNMWSYLRDKANENICEVEIKEEASSDDYSLQNISIQSLKHRNNSLSDLNGHEQPPAKKKVAYKTNLSIPKIENSLPALSINNVAATMDTLNMLKTQMNNKKSDVNTMNPDTDSSFKQFFDMQAREHLMRMQILQFELETAKFNRDTSEINRQIAIKKLNEDDVSES